MIKLDDAFGRLEGIMKKISNIWNTQVKATAWHQQGLEQYSNVFFLKLNMWKIVVTSGYNWIETVKIPEFLASLRTTVLGSQCSYPSTNQQLLSCTVFWKN